MLLNDLFQKRQYLTRIYLWVTLLVIVALVSLSTVIFMNVEDSVLKKDHQSNQMVLSQMKFNIDFMDEMIRNICISTYYRSDVQALMNENGKPTVDDMNTINQLNNSIVQSNPYVLSVYVYNNLRKLYYSTFSSFIYDDTNLDQLIIAYGKVPVLRPIVRETMTYHVRDLVEYSSVVTYFMYEMTDSNNMMNGAVIVNIKLDWLVDNIKAIDTANQDSHSQVFILDDRGEFFDAGSAQASENQPFRAGLKEAYQSHIPTGRARDADFFRATLDRKDYLVSYIRMKETNWSILIAQPNDSVVAYVDNLKTSIFLITGIVLALILMAAYSVSRGLYKPIEKLMRRVRTTGRQELADTSTADEFTYLNDAYQKSSDLLERYDLEKTDNLQSIKLYFLRMLLIHSYSIPKDEFEYKCTECNLSLEVNGPFCVIAVEIDNEMVPRERVNTKTREALESALASDIAAVLSERYPNEAVKMEGEEIAFILNAGEGSSDFFGEASGLLRRAGAAFKAAYGTGFSAAASGLVGEAKELTNARNQAVESLKYRFIFGPGCVILPDMLKRNLTSRQFDYDYSYETQFVEALRSNDMEGTATCLSRIMADMHDHEFNDIVISLARLVKLVRNLVYERNNYRREPLNINTLLSGLDPAHCETIGQFHERLTGVLEIVVSEHPDEPRPGSRDSQLADSIRSMIDSGYEDCNLNVSDLAAKSRMSTSKISRAFRENFGMSIPEYIIEVRLKKAVEWIENSRLPISEIMRKIGIENESYFYRIFKARYGRTPREYAVNKLLKSS
jgi:AraC-like DNA-binding protein